jgi:uncharacterized repeat protein (TIGR03803 family)
MREVTLHRSSTLVRVALLGSALALAATSAPAGHWNADQKRLLAATGMRSSVHHGARFGNDGHVPGWSYTVIYNFAGRPNDGDGPGAEVTLDSAGNIYGTTEEGGSYGTGNGLGTLFKVATDGTESLLHAFGGAGDGKAPNGAMVLEPNGDLIGTTSEGGFGNGTIWKLAADGTYTVLHSFFATEAKVVRGKLIQGRNGNFYGTSLFGGARGYGTVFKFNTKGTVTVLHTFDGSDGDGAQQGVISDKAGNLYGVTAYGGVHDEGTVYKIAKDGTFSTLYNFTGGSDGGFLYSGLAIDKDGSLYGSTYLGGTASAGTVFKLAPGGTLTTLYNFTGGADGANPVGDMLLMGDKLYSTTIYGGDPGCGCGVIFEIIKGKEKVLEAFTATSGDGYSAGLVPFNGVLYGTTENGSTGDNGVVFSLTKK